jgi:Arc/MetJ-type ribon-helix-helix transcriptional regulator
MNFCAVVGCSKPSAPILISSISSSPFINLLSISQLLGVVEGTMPSSPGAGNLINSFLKVFTKAIMRELLKLVDELVRLGVYGSRSEALRDFIRIGARYARQIQMVAEAVNKLFELEKEEGDIPVRLEGVLRQLRGERERF